MSKPPKQHFINPARLELDSIRITQMNAAQDMLFTMAELGEESVCFQAEIEGVLESLVCRRVTQQEFAAIVGKSAEMGERAERAARPAP